MFELLLLFVSLLLVAICGVFVMAEFALITVNRSIVERHAEKGEAKAKGVLGALTTLSTQLSSAQVGITITNLGIGFLAEPAIASYVRGPLTAIGLPQDFVPQVAIVIGIVLATVFTMIFGELVPKNLAIAKPFGAAKLVIGFLTFFTSTMRVPIRLLNNSANQILRLFGVEPREELASARSADELLSLVRRSAQKGTLAKETAAMLERSLAFGDQTAIDIMTPRVRVKSIQADASVAEALDIARRTGHSRFPVCGESIDNIVGIMHIKYAFRVKPSARKNTTVREVMSSSILVPSTIELEPLLEALRQGGLQMAVVIDEFGGTDGIVTIEDVLEELVGEVRDEHDRSKPAVQKESKNTWILSGLLRPDEIAEQIDIMLPDDGEVETLGGLIVYDLERIPRVNDHVEMPAVDEDGKVIAVKLIVRKMEGNRVDRVQLSILQPDESSLGATS